MYIVAALYQFKEFKNYQSHRDELLTLCKENHIKGTLLLAEEGINGTICGTREGIDIIHAYLVQTLGFDALEYKESFADKRPFFRMKVRLKKEIVTLGIDGVSPTKNVGDYLNYKEWNELLNDPDTVVVDTRNDYEYEIGTFKGALDPKTDCFTQFPEYTQKALADKKDKKIAMFCTGGIRCEKSTSYLKELGFENVYHLKGGILKYLEECPETESLWEGECYVFDQRVSVKHGLQPGNYDTCHGCRHPITAADKNSEKYEAGVTCPHCYGKVSEKRLNRARERQYQMQIAAKKQRKHIGDYEDVRRPQS